MAAIKLQLLLRREHRTSQRIAEAVAAAQALGLKITATGAATLSAELDSSRFAALFGSAPEEVARRSGSGTDFGSPPGFSMEGEELSVPATLAKLVESVSVAGPYLRL